MKGVFWNALKLRQTHLSQPPEAFDAVDMGWAIDELVPGMIYPIMTIAYIDQSVIAAPAIGVDDGRRTLPRIIPCRVALEQSGTISV